MTTANEPRTLDYKAAADWLAEHVMGYKLAMDDGREYWSEPPFNTDIETLSPKNDWRPQNDLRQAAMLALRLKGVHWELSAGGAFLTGGVVKACAFMPTSYTPEGLARALFLAVCAAALPEGWTVEAEHD